MIEAATTLKPDSESSGSRVVIFEELFHDTPRSFRVFLSGLERELSAAGVRYEIVSPHWPVPGKRGQAVHLLVSALLRQVVYPFWARRRFAPDAINFLVSAGLAQLLWLAPKSCRIVVFCHDVFVFLPHEVRGHRLDFGGSLRRWSLSVLQRRTLRRADLFIAPSARTRADLITYIGVPADRIVVIPHRLDDSVFKEGCRTEARRLLGWPAAAPIVFAVVNTERRKNVETLVEAVHMLVAEIPEIRLALLGHLSSRQRRLIDRSGLAERVIHVDGLDNADVAHCYQAADCLIHVSFYEGFGYPLLEAMASGCPILCSSRGAIPEVVGECAEFVDPSAPEAIARGIRSLLGDPGRRQALTTAGLVRAATYATDRGYWRALRRVREL
ncbi:MAG: glycosyltransferase family 4 protein [Acidobacteria bacterium]|nr:glycosyltransferase family 4 protein [Acidobacteriota bacterium]